LGYINGSLKSGRQKLLFAIINNLILQTTEYILVLHE
jgi:hypothetical protein